jgi:hypothetical protein
MYMSDSANMPNRQTKAKVAVASADDANTPTIMYENAGDLPMVVDDVATKELGYNALRTLNMEIYSLVHDGVLPARADIARAIGVTPQAVSQFVATRAYREHRKRLYDELFRHQMTDVKRAVLRRAIDNDDGKHLEAAKLALQAAGEIGTGQRATVQAENVNVTVNYRDVLRRYIDEQVAHRRQQIDADDVGFEIIRDDESNDESDDGHGDAT